MIIIIKFYIDVDDDFLNPLVLGRIIRKFQTSALPRLEHYHNYYMGNQEIMRRANPDPATPNNRIVNNFCGSIVDTFQGYLTGIPLTYTSKEGDISTLLDILKDNDVVNSDSEFMRDGLVSGISYQLCYINENNEKKFKSLDCRSVIPLYSNDLDEKLVACIYFYPLFNWKDEASPIRYAVNVYTDTEIYHFESDSSFNNMVISAPNELHYFGEVPFAIFNLNKENVSIFDKVITLQDAYNKVLSDNVNDFESFVESYLVLKNVIADEDDLAQMKHNRTMLLDGDSDASYLTKGQNDTQVQLLLDNLKSAIHTVSNAPDFSSEEFNQGVSSGIALSYKLVGFNNIASNVEAQFRKAVLKRIELLNNVLSLTDTDSVDVQVDFTHNLPTNISDTVEMVNSLRGLVSDETLISQLPFVDDVEVELQKVADQEAQSIYQFGEAGD